MRDLLATLLWFPWLFLWPPLLLWLGWWARGAAHRRAVRRMRDAGQIANVDWWINHERGGQ